MRFRPGRVVVRRYFNLGPAPTVVKCARVVSDDERGLLLWIAGGSPLRWQRARDGRTMRDMPFTEWVTVPKHLVAYRWEGHGILVLHPPSASHSVWWFWDAGFHGWYVNLELPVVRWDDGRLAGVDTVDHDLDLVVAPDGRWSWKDEHELDERSALPDHYWVEDPPAVRAEGERVAKLAEAGAFPFDGTWCDFRPEPDWTVPADLPPGWDRPRAGVRRYPTPPCDRDVPDRCF